MAILKVCSARYQPWYPVYWSHAKVGYIDERGFGIDAPALYYALKRNADGYPDPKTGENTAISAAYMIEAVPTFITRAGAAQNASLMAAASVSSQLLAAVCSGSRSRSPSYPACPRSRAD